MKNFIFTAILMSSVPAFGAAKGEYTLTLKNLSPEQVTKFRNEYRARFPEFISTVCVENEGCETVNPSETAAYITGGIGGDMPRVRDCFGEGDCGFGLEAGSGGSLPMPSGGPVTSSSEASGPAGGSALATQLFDSIKGITSAGFHVKVDFEQKNDPKTGNVTYTKFNLEIDGRMGKGSGNP